MVWALGYLLIGFALNWWLTRISEVLADQHWLEDLAAILFWPILVLIMIACALPPKWIGYR